MATQEEEAAQMQQAFQQFMISGGSGKKKKKKGQLTPKDERAQAVSPSTPTKSESSSEQQEQEQVRVEKSRQEQILKKAETKYWQILNAFRGTLQRDWLAVDDNLGDVISSISSLRSRIVMEHKYLLRLEEQQDTTPKGWGECGYRRGGQQQLSVSSGGLSKDDVELALNHDLKQHEKMLTGARMLLASVSEAQNALGRRLEELMLHHMATTELLVATPLLNHAYTFENNQSLETVMDTVHTVNDVFSMLAMELYRKQRLVQSVLDTVTDDLMLHHENRNESWNNSDSFLGSSNKKIPRNVAATCLREWPRGSRNSCVDVKLMQEILEPREIEVASS